MQPRARRLAVLLTACVWLLSLGCSQFAPSAGAEIAFTPCANSNDFACGHVTVPLDPSGTVPGTITLALRRHRAPVGEAHSAIIALAGGPGQSALPFSETFAELLGPIASTRDLIVFDQRGIGLSDPLACHAFEVPRLYHSFGPLIEACANQLGGNRSFYTTADTVADIEAIRQAGGYEKLVLYGTSYGTKVAELYAQEYPSHVEALVLDSVVPPNGPETLSRSTFAAVPRILRQMCVEQLCAQITANPVADLGRVVARMEQAPLRANVIDEDGNAHHVFLSADELLEILLAGDFSPPLRAEFLTAIAAAARNDTEPLARLLTTAGQGEGEPEDFDTPLYYATSCEEQDFPWRRSSDPKQRIAEASAAARALPASAFAPFTAASALQLSDVEACAYWPFSTSTPSVDDAPLPDVPTLILSGADDLRTPTANAREVAEQIPDSHLLVVPYTGHSVLTDEQTRCASEALQALFAPSTIKPCHPAPPPLSLRPPPLPPQRLALVSPTKGYSGLPGRTLHAVKLTVEDFVRELALRLTLSDSLESITALPTLRLGGLRAGWAEFANGTFSLHGYSYVPGMTLSGTIKAEAASLQVSGPAAAHGTLHLGPHHTLVGRLAGRHVVLPANSTATAAIVGSDAQASHHFGADADAGARLAQLIGGIIQP
ncbi:MAG TPA: alpha/beta fold hydrolase [Solirubrobacteraceae bacterium]|jgi:pimeloyl-ACP methyl ester carboxylesterase|nr:alpha/beta fold hydrolase [Solirubrobacteraceae bacterium]